MPNDYYERQASLPEFTTARADDIRQELDGVQSGFEKLPTPRQDGTKGFTTPFTIVDPSADNHPATHKQVSNEKTKNGQQDIRLDAIETILAGLGNAEERYTTLRYVATAGQTEIVLPLQFESLAYVYKNGERLFQTVDFDYESSTKTITFYQALTAGDIILVDVGLVPDSVLTDLIAIQDDVTSKHSDVETWHSDVDGWQQQVSEDKDTTLAASIAAQADANYEGDFVSGVTNAEKGKSYSFDNEIWRCLSNTSDDPSINNASWKKAVSVDDVNKAEERALGVGVKIYRGKNGNYVQNGDVVPSENPPYTHLAVPINGRAENFAISPVASGLVANLTTTGATIGGVSVKLFIANQPRAYYTFEDFGALGYPNDDTEAFERIQDYFDSNFSGLPVMATKPAYLTTTGLIVRAGHTLEGQGCDYWDTWRPNQNELVKTMNMGTTILFAGSGEKTFSAINLDDNTPTKTSLFNNETVDVELIKFNHGDSVDGKPATPRMFSVGIVVERNATLKQLRVVPEFRGIDGYNDFDTLDLAADWDVGVWFQGANEASCYNVQAAGYWRMIGTLVTENNGTFEQIANPERCIITRLRTQGVRGVAVRNSAQWRTFDDGYSSTTITCEYNQYWTLTSQNKFRLIGPYQVYQFTGYQVSPDGTKITLTGVTPNLPAIRPEILRSPSMGNNLAGTVFNDCVFASLEHSSGTPAKKLGLPEAAPFEFSGYPLRGLKLVNTKAQTTWDRVAGIFGDCRDLKWINGQIENGLLIAYDNTETIGSTENLRFNNVYDESGTLDKTLFTPRGFFNDYSSFPTEFSDGALEIRPPKTGRKNKVLRLRSDDGKIRGEFKNSGEDCFLRTGRNFSLNRDDGSSLVTVYGGSGNATFAANVAPAEPNGGSVGAVSLPWSAVHATNGTIQPSDRRLKENGQPIPDAVFRAWQEVRQKIIMWMWRPEFKDSDRFHFGPYAQDIIDAFDKYGENPFIYALNCYDKWDDEFVDVPAEIDEIGNIIRPAERQHIVKAGDRYSIRKDELFMLEIAYQVWKEKQ